MQQSRTGRSSGNLREQPSVSSHALARMRLITLHCLSEYSLHWISLFETETASARMHWARMRLITLRCLSEYSLHWISLFETETASARMHWARMRLITLCCLSEYSLHWISLFETETASARMHWQGCVLSHCAVCLNTVYTGSACLKLKLHQLACTGKDASYHTALSVWIQSTLDQLVWNWNCYWFIDMWNTCFHIIHILFHNGREIFQQIRLMCGSV